MPPLLAAIASFFAVLMMLVGQVSAGAGGAEEASASDASSGSAWASKDGDTRRHVRHVFFVFKADQISKVDVASGLGNIELTPHKQSEMPKWIRTPDRDIPDHNPETDVLVIAQIHAKHAEVLNDPTLEPTIEGGVLTVKAVWPEKDYDNSPHGVDYVVRMPGVTAFELKSGLGDVRVDHAHGEGSAKTGLGDVALRGQVGPVDAKTGLGDIDVDFDADHADHAGRSVLATGLGDIRAHGMTEGELVTGQGDLTATITSSPTGEIKIASGMGTVKVELPDGIDANLEATAAMGTLRVSRELCDLDQPNSPGLKSVKAVLGGGGHRIVCSSNMGGVFIN